MTSSEPPEDQETEGVEQPPIPGYRLPDRGTHTGPLKEAVLFVPEGHDEGDPLDVKVWSVNPTTMGLIIMRRC